MADEVLYDRIEKYLLGKLPANEVARLEAEMAADPALADQVALRRIALIGLQRLTARDMRTRFEQWDQETDDPPSGTASPPNKAPINLWFWTSIVLLLLLAVGAFRYFGQIVPERNKQEQQEREIAVRDSLIETLRAGYREKTIALDSLLGIQGTSNDPLNHLEIKRLLKELEQKDQILRELESRRLNGKPQIAMQLAPSPSMFRSVRGDQDSSVIGKAKEALEGAKFAEAVQLLKSIPASDPRQAEVVQYLPYALFYAGKYREAIPAFLKLWEQDPADEYVNAQGYLLLCYVAEGDLQEAQQMRLVILQNPKHKFFKTAKDLGEIIR